jgi:hypothetical protein
MKTLVNHDITTPKNKEAQWPLEDLSEIFRISA